MNWGGYSIFDPSVSQSVSPSVSQSAETAQQNFVKLCNYEGHKMCISTGNFDSIFFLGVMPFLNLEIWPKWKILLKTVPQRTPLKLLNGISWNFVVMKDIMCRCVYLQEIFIPFVSKNYALFELRNLTKMKETTETVCQRNSSETAQ